MSSSILTRKGQTTIPLAIRDYLGIHAGDKLEFYVDTDGRVVVMPLTQDVALLKGLLSHTRKKTSIKDVQGCLDYKGAKKSLKEMGAGVVKGAKKKK